MQYKNLFKFWLFTFINILSRCIPMCINITIIDNLPNKICVITKYILLLVLNLNNSFEIIIPNTIEPKYIIIVKIFTIYIIFVFLFTFLKFFVICLTQFQFKNICIINNIAIEIPSISCSDLPVLSMLVSNIVTINNKTSIRIFVFFIFYFFVTIPLPLLITILLYMSMVTIGQYFFEKFFNFLTFYHFNVIIYVDSYNRSIVLEKIF